MNEHFKISLIKSILRILGCVGTLCTVQLLAPVLPLSILGGTFLIAELLGILEEIKDKRK